MGGEVVNDQKPIWVEPKTQVTEEQYRQFYQHLTHQDRRGAALAPAHGGRLADPVPAPSSTVPAPTSSCSGSAARTRPPASAPSGSWSSRDCHELVPEYLRFLYGLVDSEDLPLNVSRETLQDNTVIRRIRNTLVKGVLDRLQKLAEEKPDDYLTFYKQFGPFLKEGVATDLANRDRVARLLRFLSSHTENSGGPPTVARLTTSAAPGRSEADLLPRWPRPRLDQEEPEPGDLPPPRPGGALS